LQGKKCGIDKDSGLTVKIDSLIPLISLHSSLRQPKIGELGSNPPDHSSKGSNLNCGRAMIIVNIIAVIFSAHSNGSVSSVSV
jgi:hypothetical protein